MSAISILHKYTNVSATMLWPSSGLQLRHTENQIIHKQHITRQQNQFALSLPVATIDHEEGGRGPLDWRMRFNIGFQHAVCYRKNPDLCPSGFHCWPSLYP